MCRRKWEVPASAWRNRRAGCADRKTVLAELTITSNGNRSCSRVHATADLFNGNSMGCPSRPSRATARHVAAMACCGHTVARAKEPALRAQPGPTSAETRLGSLLPRVRLCCLLTLIGAEHGRPLPNRGESSPDGARTHSPPPDRPLRWIGQMGGPAAGRTMSPGPLVLAANRRASKAHRIRGSSIPGANHRVPS
jgi:hypothetical protein